MQPWLVIHELEKMPWLMLRNVTKGSLRIATAEVD